MVLSCLDYDLLPLNLSTKYEVCNVTNYEDLYGDAKCTKCVVWL